MSLTLETIQTTISKVLSFKGKKAQKIPEDEVEVPVKGEIPEKLYPAEAFRVDTYFRPWMGLR